MISAPLPLLAKEASLGKPSRLYTEPFKDAAVIATLSATSTVKVLERKGGWSRIQHQQSEGWIRTLDLRFGKSAEGSVVADTFGLATGRAGSGNVVATTGIRGLDEEDLKSANFSAEQISLAESYRIDASVAESAAARAGLQSTTVEYFEDITNATPAARRHDR
ncbi:hypothetical protein GCM10022278_05200 [Allohahella marinimesophila]|uniref:SH3b domain-containing protein n=1 Tax=Allohahella marinimesophila TaxID=1054972 RepID=A0ABP7NKF5_9GAMM